MSGDSRTFDQTTLTATSQSAAEPFRQDPAQLAALWALVESLRGAVGMCVGGFVIDGVSYTPREVDICVGGVVKKIKILASEPYDA